MLGFFAPAIDLNAHPHYRTAPAIHRQITVAEGGPLPYFGGSGTGGIENIHFAMTRQGYKPFVIVQLNPVAVEEAYAPYTDLMKEVKAGFGRTLSHLPSVFGVSRQTLYNWLNGETPKTQHQEKLVQLAAAARLFIEAGYKPTAQSLERSVTQGKSFVELVSQGADGRDTAEKLISLEKRGAVAREKLSTLLGKRTKPRLDAADIGRPALNEEA